MTSTREQNTITVVQTYFRLGDQKRPEILDLFHEDVEIYFPKFGFGAGRESFIELGKAFEGALEFIQHDDDTLRFISTGDDVVVEGTSGGKLSGKSWTGGETPGGRHVYLDPDYTGEDAPRFRWGTNRKW